MSIQNIREWVNWQWNNDSCEHSILEKFDKCIDEIERLTAENERMRKELAEYKLTINLDSYKRGIEQGAAARCAEIALEQMFPVDIGSFGDTVSKEEAHNIAVENIADAIRKEFNL